MPVTFNLFRAKKFPERPPAADALVFQRGTNHLAGRPAQTFVTYKRHIPPLDVEVYFSEHEILKHVEGRLYDGQEFHEFFKRNKVLLGLKRDANLLLCKSSGAVARNLVDQLNEAYPFTFRADYLNVDFETLRPQINELNGIWISQIDQPNIDTLAMFGLEVDRSQLYSSLRALGHAASILIRQIMNGVAVPVIISAKGSITFPQPAAEEDQIERAINLYSSLLLHGLVEKESRKTAKDRRAEEREEARRNARGSTTL